MVDVSVIMPAFNEAGRIQQQLNALRGQCTQADWELLVVDNGSSDDTAAVAAQWFRNHPEVTGRAVDGSSRRGPCAARNIGAEAARGDLLLFCDADDEADPGWIEGMVAALGSNRYVGGPLAFDRLNSLELITSRLNNFPATNPAAHHSGPDYVISANMGIAASLYRAVGGMDETLVTAAWDDVDLSWRIYAAGERPSAAAAVMQYRFRANPKALLQQQRNYGRGEAIMRRKWPQHFERFELRQQLFGLTKDSLRSVKHRGTPGGSQLRQAAAYRMAMLRTYLTTR